MAAGDTGLERWKALGIRAWSLIGVLILVGVMLWVLGRIGRALVPFLMAAVIVFLLRAPVRAMQGRGMKRWLAVTVCYLVAIAVLTLAGIYIFPLLAAQFAQFLTAFPGYVAQAGKLAETMTIQYWQTAPQWLRDAVSNIQASFAAQLGSLAKLAATDVLTAGGSVVGFVLDAVLALFIAFYVLLDLDRIRLSFVRVAGPRWRPDMEVILHEISTAVGGFLRGQTIVALADGVLTAIGLTIVHMPYALVIGLITGVLSVIPYVGPVVGGVIVVVTGLFVGPTTALLGLAVMVVVQQVDASVLGPRIMSREVDLHPTLVIFSLLVGAQVAGLIGMLVAIPVAATGKALFAHYLGTAEERAAGTPPAGSRPAAAEGATSDAQEDAGAG